MKTSSENSGIISSIIKNAMVDLNVSIPCTVTAVNNHLVNVQLSIDRSRVQPNGTRVNEQTPVIEQVRIVYPTTQNGFVRVPIVEGDRGLIIFSDYDLDNWILGNGANPNTARVHDITDAFYFPAFAVADEQYDHDCTEIGFGANSIKVCANGTEIVGGLVVDGIDFGTHVHPETGAVTLPPQ